MDQHTFVRSAQENYEQRLMDPTSDRFEDAHYPLNRKKENEVVPLHRLDHAIQGVWQSELRSQSIKRRWSALNAATSTGKSRDRDAGG